MPATGEARVSNRGQMSLPADARHRWGLDEGGAVGYLDLGDAILMVPGGIAALRSAVLDEIDDATWAAAREGFGDPDLADQ